MIFIGVVNVGIIYVHIMDGLGEDIVAPCAAHARHARGLPRVWRGRATWSVEVCH